MSAASNDAPLERCLDALRQLDAIVRNKLHNDTAALAARLIAASNAPHAAATTPTTTHPQPRNSNHQPPGQCLGHKL